MTFRAREAHAKLEALEQTLGRLRATEPTVHAYVHVDAAGARAAARAIDASSAMTHLDGDAFGVKDVIDVAGMPTACGCPALAAEVAEDDAVAVSRLRAAGGVVVGKHVTHELTCGLDQPATRNPWDVSRYPGGSSAGGGVSVAVGSASFALGTDAAGSARIPAAMTGVVGFKPTHGRIDTRGIAPAATAPSIDHVAILARTADEAAQVFAIVADPGRGEAVDALELRLDGVRFGVLDSASTPAMKSEECVQRAFDVTCRQLVEAGAELVEVPVPSFASAPGAASTYFAAELAAGNRDSFDARAPGLHPNVRRLLESGLRISPEQLRTASHVRSALTAELGRPFCSLGLDALLTPTAPYAAPKLAALRPSRDLARLVAFTCAFNLTGQPAISVPCGFTPTRLPIGLQIVGAAGDDTRVLGIASAYQRLTTWHLQRPALPVTA